MFILASNSPRRKQLLALGGWVFQVLPARVDETPRSAETPQEYVLRLAETKAQAVAAHCSNADVVIAADTTVVDQGEILGKPADHAEAEQMLRRLRGRSHAVYTALAVISNASQVQETDICCTDVPMRAYTDQEIRAYIATGDPLDKAGAYAIQHPEFHPVARLDGCYANVVGLPLCHLTRTLRRLGIEPQNEIHSVCQHTLQYRCPIYAQILAGEA